jgi:hypothetical protein
MAAAASAMWLDVPAGGASDVLLGALIDAGRSLEFAPGPGRPDAAGCGGFFGDGGADALGCGRGE